MPVVQFPLRSGLNEADDPKSLPPGTLTYLENCVWKKSGRIEKRNGYLALSQSVFVVSTVVAAQLVVPRAGVLALAGGYGSSTNTTMFEYSASGGKWSVGDYITTPTFTWRTIVNSASGVSDADIAYSSLGYYIVVWQDAAGNIYVKVIDAMSGAIVFVDTKVNTVSSNCTTSRVAVVGTRAVIGFAAGANIKLVSLNLLTMQLDSESTVSSDLAGAFDMCTIGTNLVIAHEWTGAAPKMRLIAYAPTGFAPTTYTAGASGSVNQTTAGSLRLVMDGAAGESLYVGWSTSLPNAINLAIADANTLAQTVAPFALTSTYGTVGIARTSSTTAQVAATNGDKVVVVTLSSSGSTSAQYTTANSALVGRPVLNSTTGQTYYPVVPVSSGVSTNPYFIGYGATTLICEASGSRSVYAGATPLKVTGTINPRLGTSQPLHAWRGITGPGGKTVWVLPVDTTGFGSQGLTNAGVQLVELTPTGAPTRATSAYATVVMSGSSPLFYDGARCQEYGFFGPSTKVAVATSTTGGTIEAGTFIYSVVPVYTDANGIVHRGPPSLPVSVTTTGTTSSNTLTIDALSLSSKEPMGVFAKSVYFEVYRSAVTGGISGSVLYFTKSYVQNVPSSSTLTFVDTASSASLKLTTQRLLYTTGGILDDQAPPSATYVHTHRNRVWLISADKRTLYFSKDFSQDPTYAPGFNDQLSLRFEEDLAAVATLDDKLVVLGATSIWTLNGDGPAATGLQSDYFVQKTQTDVGCSNPKSVVSCSAGVFFQTTRGIYLLDRSLNVTFVGKEVQDRLTLYPTITSAVLVGKYNQIRFTCSNGTNGITLVFDYVTGQWATFTNYNAASPGTSAVVQDACVVNGVYTWATSAGAVYQETETTNLDGTLFVPMRFDIAPVNVRLDTQSPTPGPIGFQRVRKVMLAADTQSPASISMQYAFDYSTSWTQSYTWTDAALAALGSSNVGLRVGSQNGASPRCTALAISVRDAAPTTLAVGTGKGSTFSALGLEVVPRDGMQRRGPRAEG